MRLSLHRAGPRQLGGVTDSLQVKTDNQLTGTTDFSIVTGVKTTAAGTTLVTAGDDVKLSINKDGFVEFKVGSLTLTSEEKVTTVDSKATGTFGTDEYQPFQNYLNNTVYAVIYPELTFL